MILTIQFIKDNNKLKIKMYNHKVYLIIIKLKS